MPRKLPIALWGLLIFWGAAAFSAPPQLAIIIDDIGYSAPLGERSLRLKGDFTYAILPQAPQGARLARLGAELGKEIMVHNPMSTLKPRPLDAGALTEQMSYPEFQHTLTQNLVAIPQARGLNNHMGSRLTQDPQAMGWLMKRLGDQGYYFIDSRTTADSQAWETARHYRVPTLKRDVFLDHDQDILQIARQVDQAIQLAKSRGYALAIGHPHPETLAVLEQLGPALEASGVALVPVSTLLQRPEAAPQHYTALCLAPPISLWKRPDTLPGVDRPLIVSQQTWLRQALHPALDNPTPLHQNQHLLLNRD